MRLVTFSIQIKGLIKNSKERNSKKKKRRKFITKTSKPVTERKIGDLYSKKGKFELAHRASLKQLVKLGVDYPLESLGFDTRNVNQELVKPFEKALESIYKKQNLIADKYKGKTIPNNTYTFFFYKNILDGARLHVLNIFRF